MMLNILIKLLGGVPEEEYRKQSNALSELQYELDLYKEFTRSVSSSFGDYSARRAQSDFRQLMNDCEHNISVEPFDFSKQNMIDAYLECIVNSLQRLNKNNSTSIKP